MDLENEDESLEDLEEESGHDDVIGPKHDDDDHGGGHGEPWLMSYADMMTLLFGFFVLMYTFAAADRDKKEVVKKEISESMGGTYESPYESLKTKVQALADQLNVSQDTDIDVVSDALKITSKGTQFFQSGSTDLTNDAQGFIHEVVAALAAEADTYNITVEGHTDDDPIYSTFIPSNWELSSLRAGAVVRVFEKKGFPKNRLRALGLADTQPLVPNRDNKGEAIRINQAQNRRIVIYVHRK